MNMAKWFPLGVVLSLLLVACSEPTVQQFGQGEFPAELSRWHLLKVEAGELVPNHRVEPYDLKSALFTDYAHKFRTVYVPEGSAPAASLANGGFELPAGSILTKTFYYPKNEQGLLKTHHE